MTGYLRIYRHLLSDPIFRDKQEALCYIWMALMAAWAPCTIYDQGQKYELDRGELVASLRSLSSLFGWSRSKVDRFLRRLEEGQKVSRRVSTKGRKSQVIHLLDYESFYGQIAIRETEAVTQTKQQSDSLNKEESNKLNQTKRSAASAAQDRSSKIEMRELRKIADACLSRSSLTSVATFAPGFQDLSPIAAWLKAGADLEADIYPVVQAKAKASIRSWAYFTPAIMETLARRTYLEQSKAEDLSDDHPSLHTATAPSQPFGQPHPAPNPAGHLATARAGRPRSAHATMLAGAMAEAERSEGSG